MNYADILSDEGKVVMYEVMIWIMLLMISFLTGHKIVKVKTHIQNWLNRHRKKPE